MWSLTLPEMRNEFDPWFGKVPGRKLWKPTQCFIRKIPMDQEELAGYTAIHESQRIRL